MKNTLSLENYGVVEMTTREMKTTNGGCTDWLCWHHIDAFIEDFVKGFNAGSGAEC